MNDLSRGRRPPVEEKNKKFKIVKWLILLLLLLFLVKGCYTSYIDGNKGPSEPVIGGDFLPEGKDAKDMTEKEIKQAAQVAADSSYYNLLVYPEASFDQKTGAGNFKVKNSKSNVYPINVELTEVESGRVVYNSGAILPGQEINEVILDQIIDAGEYEMSAEVSIYNAETKLKQGIVSAKVSVSIKP